MMVFLRPKASDSGPANSVPMPMPSTKLVSTSCAWLGRSGVSSRAICGRAGSIESIEKAMVANSIAARAMNSPWLRGLIVMCVSFAAHRGRRGAPTEGGWRQKAGKPPETQGA